MARLKTLGEVLQEWWDFVDADPTDSEAFTFVLPDGRIVKKRAVCMSSEHFGQLAWQFKRMSGSSSLKVQAAIAC